MNPFAFCVPEMKKKDEEEEEEEEEDVVRSEEKLRIQYIITIKSGPV